MRMFRDLYRDHREMFALTASEQARDDISNTHIDLEYDKLEAAQLPATTEESGSNFIEALNTNVADFFPNAADTIPPVEGGDAEHGEDDGTPED